MTESIIALVPKPDSPPPNTFRFGVGMIITRDGDNRVLLCRRIANANNPIQSWQFPQGGVEGEEDVNDALIREAHEEVRLDPPAIAAVERIPGIWAYLLPKPNVKCGRGQVHVWFLIVAKPKWEPVIDQEEFSQSYWASYSDAIGQAGEMKAEVYTRLLPYVVGKVKL